MTPLVVLRLMAAARLTAPVHVLAPALDPVTKRRLIDRCSAFDRSHASGHRGGFPQLNPARSFEFWLPLRGVPS